MSQSSGKPNIATGVDNQIFAREVFRGGGCLTVL